MPSKLLPRGSTYTTDEVLSTKAERNAYCVGRAAASRSLRYHHSPRFLAIADTRPRGKACDSSITFRFYTASSTVLLFLFERKLSSQEWFHCARQRVLRSVALGRVTGEKVEVSSSR